MAGTFKIIAITTPDPDSVEMATLCRLLEAGAVDLLHVRIPSGEKPRIRTILREIPESLRSRVTIHYFADLALEFGLGGVHFQSSKNRTISSDRDGMTVSDPFLGGNADRTPLRISKSCHSLEEISQFDCYDYVTLSPIFDSISKPGYESGFALETLSPMIRGRNVIALGGVTPELLERLHGAGFSGAAMLGAIPAGISEMEEKKFIEKLSAIRRRLHSVRTDKETRSGS